MSAIWADVLVALARSAGVRTRKSFVFRQREGVDEGIVQRCPLASVALSIGSA